MSNVVKPRGRKPAAVYWRRRIVLLVAVVAAALVGWRWVGGADEPVESTGSPQPVATSAVPDPARTPTPTLSAETVEPPQQETTQQGTTQQETTQRETTEETADRSEQRVSTDLAAPRGDCAVADVVVVPDVVDTETRGEIPLRLGLSTTGRSACTLELTADKVALEVTSGDDMIWRASLCPDVLDPQTLTLRPGWLSYVEATWSGRRASDDCLASNEYAEAGYYWAEAAIIGGEPSRGQFRLEQPPPPPPPASKKDAPDGDPREGQEGERDRQDQPDEQGGSSASAQRRQADQT